jgi:alpha-beta hydrolase superfamily lysophospholipase
MPTFDGAAGRVYYKAWRVTGPRVAALVFLHGFGEHSGLYHRLGHALNAAGIELWALDEIGHGLTAGERAVFDSLDDLVENGRRLTALAEQAQPGAPVWLAGHSLGAAVAAVSALRDPARYAGLIVSGAPLSPLDWLTDPAAADGGLDLDPADLSADPFYLDELTHDPLAFTSTDGARSLAAVLTRAWSELDPALAAIPLPVLLIHGELDPVVPVAQARAWSARLEHAALAEYPGARHDILNETVHRQVADTIIDFIVTNATPATSASTPATSAPRPA